MSNDNNRTTQLHALDLAPPRARALAALMQQDRPAGQFVALEAIEEFSAASEGRYPMQRRNLGVLTWTAEAGEKVLTLDGGFGSWDMMSLVLDDGGDQSSAVTSLSVDGQTVTLGTGGLATAPMEWQANYKPQPLVIGPVSQSLVIGVSADASGTASVRVEAIGFSRSSSARAWLNGYAGI